MMIKTIENKEETKKTLAIIGGGISGLMSGILALKEGYTVTIFEKNRNLGGAFSESLNYGYANNFILLGTSYDSIRKKLNSIIDFSFCFPKDTDYIYMYKGSEKVYFYRDLKRLNNELNALAPMDANAIEDLIKGIKEASLLDYSFNEQKKLFLFNKEAKQLNSFFNKYGNKSIDQFCEQIKNEDLKKALLNFISPNNSICLLMLIMGMFASHRLTMVNNPSDILEKFINEYTNNDGIVKINSEVRKITNSNDGIIITYGSDDIDEKYDLVVYASDCHNLFDNLINKKYLSSKGKVYLNNSLDSNMMSSFVCTYNIDSNNNDLLEFANKGYFSCGIDKKFRVGCKNNDEFKIFIKDNRLTIMFNQNNDDYEFFKLLYKNQSTYKREINRITNDIEEVLIRYLGITKFSLEKVFTPVDFANTFNHHDGGINGLGLTPNTIGASIDNEIKGFDNLYISSAGLIRPFWFYSAAVASIKAIDNIKEKNKRD